MPSSPFATLAATRRTVHRFDPSRDVPEAAVRRAAGLATLAPNHKLTEPWTFVLLGPQARRAVIGLAVEGVRAASGDAAAEARRAVWEAVPAYLVALCRRSPHDAHREREDYAAVAAAVHTLTLALWEDGIGAKWTTGPVTRLPAFFSCIGADPDVDTVAGLLMLGYPADVPPPRPRLRADTFRVTD